MFTQYDFYKGMFCELGGEFVDTNHEDLQKLASEVGVEMQNLTTDGATISIFSRACSIRRRTWWIRKREGPLRRFLSTTHNADRRSR